LLCSVVADIIPPHMDNVNGQKGEEWRMEGRAAVKNGRQRRQTRRIGRFVYKLPFFRAA